jgi:hypothetical protein
MAGLNYVLVFMKEAAGATWGPAFHLGCHFCHFLTLGGLGTTSCDPSDDFFSLPRRFAFTFGAANSLQEQRPEGSQVSPDKKHNKTGASGRDDSSLTIPGTHALNHDALATTPSFPPQRGATNVQQRKEKPIR